MEREQYAVAPSPLGRIAVSNAAIVQIVGQAAAERYGVVALAELQVHIEGVRGS